LRRAKRVLVGLSCAAFTLFGLLIAIYEPGDRLGGLFVVLFFGSGLLVSLLPAFARTRGPDRRVAVVAHDGLLCAALVVRVSVGNARVGGIAAAGWAAGGVILWMARSSTTPLRLLGLVCALLFGGVAIVVGLQQLRGRAFVALLPEGVLGRSAAGDSFVPWDAIEAVGVVRMSDTPLNRDSRDRPRRSGDTALGEALCPREPRDDRCRRDLRIPGRARGGRSKDDRPLRGAPRGALSDRAIVTATIRDRRAPFPGSSIGRASGC
jgi:hypothetical protein